MGKINQRKLNELLIINNIHRLSDETLNRIILETEDEIEHSIDQELSET